MAQVNLETMPYAPSPEIAPKSLAQGGTNVATEIAAAFTFSKEVRLRTLASSYYPVASTIVVPAGKRLICPPETLFIPTADVDVFRVEEGGHIDGPTIEVNGYAGYTKAAIALYGTTTWGTNQLTTIRNVRGRAKTGATAEGIGVLLDAGTVASGHITFVQVENVHLHGFATGIKLNSPTPASGQTWVNGNVFRGVTLNQPKRAIDLRCSSTAGGANGNHFIGVQIQSVLGMESALYCEGSYNSLSPLLLWDWDVTVGATTPSVTFTDSAVANDLSTNEAGMRVKDTGWGNRVDSTFTGGLGRKAERILGAPGGTFNPAKYGNQDDWLAFAATRGGVTVTGAAPSAGALSNLFDPNSTNTATWNTAGPNAVEVNWGTAQRGQVYGITFSDNRKPKTVLCEVQKGGVWVEVLNVSDNVAQALEVQPNDPNSFGITGVRWTLSGFSRTNTVNEVICERLWMFEAREPGRLWAKRHAPEFTGTTATTAPAAGAAAALPATPAGYFTVSVNGTNRQVPYY